MNDVGCLRRDILLHIARISYEYLIELHHPQEETNIKHQGQNMHHRCVVCRLI